MKNNKSIVKLIAVLSLIIVSIFMLTGCGNKNKKANTDEGPSYKDPLINYFDGIKNRDLEQVVKAFPEFAKMDEKIKSEDIEELYKYYQNAYGTDVTMDYEIGNAVKLEEVEISELKQQITTVYNVENIDITEAYIVTITVTFKGGNSQSETETSIPNSDTEQNDMYVIKYQGNWYML